MVFKERNSMFLLVIWGLLVGFSGCLEAAANHKRKEPSSNSAMNASSSSTTASIVRPTQRAKTETKGKSASSSSSSSSTSTQTANTIITKDFAAASSVVRRQIYFMYDGPRGGYFRIAAQDNPNYVVAPGHPSVVKELQQFSFGRQLQLVAGTKNKYVYSGIAPNEHLMQFSVHEKFTKFFVSMGSFTPERGSNEAALSKVNVDFDDVVSELNKLSGDIVIYLKDGKSPKITVLTVAEYKELLERAESSAATISSTSTLILDEPKTPERTTFDHQVRSNDESKSEKKEEKE